LEGDAVFTAAPVANKPFVVSTLFARASTFGAMYRVALDRGMTVEVYDGEVDVAVPGMPAVTVKKGQRYRLIDERAGSIVAQAFVREPALESIAREHRNGAERSLRSPDVDMGADMKVALRWRAWGCCLDERA